MDTVATPAALVAGTIMTASQVGEMSSLLKWSVAIIAGGGVCGVIQAGTVVTRAASSGTTGGFGNFVVSAAELFLAIVITILAIAFPLVCLFVLFVVARKMVRRIAKARSPVPTPAALS